MPPKRLRIANAAALLLCLLFFIVGVLWISELGIQSDEALFTAAIYPPIEKQYRMRVFHRDFPLMVMTYVGTLKAAIWAPVFAVWEPSAASLRLPAVALAAFTVWLFYRLLLPALGLRAALAGCALLATDSMFLLMSRWDWGPVVLQHLCLVGGILLLLRFHQNLRQWWLFLGFFVLGLGLWDKAIFVWSLAGMGLGVLIVFPRELIQVFTRRRCGIAVAGFLLGALPLVIYNVRHQLVTFRGNTSWSTEDFRPKVHLLKVTWQGEALFGSLMRNEWEGPVREAQDAGERLLFHINGLSGHPRRNLLGPLLLLALAVLPFIWRSAASRAALFALVFCTVTFLLMALTRGAGGGAHHTVLLWPFPHLFVVALLAEASKRIKFGLVLLSLLIGSACIANLLVTSTYYTNMLRHGSTVIWTDAIYSLSDALKSERPNWICLQDWGFYDNLRLLHRGALPLCVTGTPDTVEGKVFVRKQLEQAKTLYIGHTESTVVEAESYKHWTAFLQEAGYHKVNRRVFPDSNGRPIIEMYSVEKDISH